ncbi:MULTISPECIES: mersacidin/lichenicidin family type 2 lantibiotic [Myxococcus]|uniref:mersacidin/lichenicidin family type 2 lantibiotic n=1 Tax=Myxococcus TaxID=32 RepID=UPI0013D4D982|nr:MULTISPECIES: mersacidin/lichenicidin family type 2 lantibiotic [Myxococcus]MCP3166920.1 mersacidin/lichenicidin family type 2 lantibiotic [Myxococcus qinghaiensis]NVJ24819.1 mersacidin/lichenicidin family type 2 lantibiotic [Myxococcus sp. AM011]
MSDSVKSEIIRAWKDEEFRNNLSESERDLIPANPAGILELTDEVLGVASGGLAAASCDWCSC